MRLGGIYLNGGEYEATKIGGLSRSLSKAWEVSTSDCSLTLLDKTKELYNTIALLPEGEVLVFEIYSDTGERIFLGDVDPVQCTWNERDETTVIRASNFFARAKGAGIREATWTRPAQNVHIIAEEISTSDDNATQFLEFDHVADLFHDDELEGTFTEDGKTTTEKRKILAVMPENNRVKLDKKPSKVAPEGMEWIRTNKEIRFMPLSVAFNKLSQDIIAVGSVLARPLNITTGFMGAGPGWISGQSQAMQDQTFTVQIQDETTVLVLSEPVTTPFPIPKLDGLRGSVTLITAYDGTNVCAAFRGPDDTVTEFNLVLFGTENESSLFVWTWPGTASNAGAYPADWSRHLTSAPSRLIPPLFSVYEYTAGWDNKPIPNIYGESDLIVPPDDPIESFTTLDYNNELAYALITEAEQLAFKKYSYNSVAYDWTFVSTIKSNVPIDDVRGFSFDHVTSTVYVMGVVSGETKLFSISTTDGALTAITGDLGSSSYGAIMVLSVARLIIQKIGRQRLSIFDIADSFSQTFLDADGGNIIATSIQSFNGRIYLLCSGSDGVSLQAFEKDTEGVWSLLFKDVLLKNQVDYGIIIIQDENLWIGCGGQLWLHSKTVRPVLPRADVFGMSVGAVCQNLAFFANAYVWEDMEGLVRVISKTAYAASSINITEYEKREQDANWGEQYQRVVVRGRDKDVVGSMETGIPGEQWSISKAPFIFSSSHCRAMAGILLEYARYKRKPLNIRSSQFGNIQPLDVFTIDGGNRWLCLSVSFDLEQPDVTGTNESPADVEALEILPHE